MSEIIHCIGRRKTSIARVYMKKGKGNITVNEKNYTQYFPTGTLQFLVQQPFSIIKEEAGQQDVNAVIIGGGVKGQAEALRLAISRALVKLNPEYKPALKAASLMTRDPRMVERKKPGQKKARKRFQFTKR
ncbi:MAG TPA: 30S ribosomal protein S9 [Bacteroidia bacterium]|jgi:small subunit ribosomal protein S9|nr:30S ribosomal protein S9 [Bacteroidia bacterium]